MDSEAGIPPSLNVFYSSYSSYAFSSAYADVWRPEARRLTLVRLLRGDREGAGGRPQDVGGATADSHQGGQKLPCCGLIMSLLPRSKLIFLRVGSDQSVAVCGLSG